MRAYSTDWLDKAIFLRHIFGMLAKRSFLILGAVVGYVTSFVASGEEAKINGPVLSWHLDPTKTMTISWIEHTKGGKGQDISKIEVRQGESPRWVKFDVETRPFADTGHLVRSVVLDKLKPSMEYEFRLPSQYADRSGKFRTAPADSSKPVRFVTGGDMFHTRELLDAMNVRAGEEDPLFALLGGDLAYANAKNDKKWYEWVESWQQNAVTPSGFMIPMIVAIGNHETITPGAWVPPNVRPPKSAKYFYSFFLTPEKYKSNYSVDFGDYMSIVILDSNHTQTVVSQTAWLARQLEKRQNSPALFVCYHRPTYGTGVKKNDLGVRTEWVPLFEKFGVDTVFENDHHTYKRTLPLRKGEVEEGGVMFMGDGAWGVRTRKIPKETHDLPYMATAQEKRHLIVVEVQGEEISYLAKEADGTVIDRYPSEGE